MLGITDTANTVVVMGVPMGITPGTSKINLSSGMPIFGLGPLLAYQHITQIIRTAFPQSPPAKMAISRDFPDTDYTKNLILLGFPLGNEVTERIMSDLDLPLIFQGHQLVDRDSKKVLYQASVENGEVKQDFGYLVRAPNPYDSNSVVFIMAGCETYGVKAAAEFLTSANLHELWGFRWPKSSTLLSLIYWITPRRWKNEYYQIVVSVNVRGLITSEPKLVSYSKL